MLLPEHRSILQTLDGTLDSMRLAISKIPEGLISETCRLSDGRGAGWCHVHASCRAT